MVTPADVARLAEADRQIVELARGTLAQVWARLDLADLDRSRDALLAFMQANVAQYGDLAAAVTAEWYDELRAQAGIAGQFRAIPGPSAPANAVEGTTRWAVGMLYQDNPTGTLTALRMATGRFILNTGRNTVATNATRERARWARVPTGAKTCEFCMMLASRGFAYSSQHTALGSAFHADCDCVTVPAWGNRDPKLPGYNPKALYGQYLEARTAAESGDPHAILAAWRQL
jgi:hypothetical protein